MNMFDWFTLDWLMNNLEWAVGLLSIGCVISGLQVGIVNCNSCFFFDISKPKLIKIFTMSFR